MVIAACCVVFLLAGPPLSARGDAPSPERQALLDGTVRFLQESQREDGGFAQAGEPTQGTSAWVALALAAAGINPRNQARPCGTDAYTHLAENFPAGGASAAQLATTELERELLVVDAAGTDPHDFAGFDLVAEILDRQLPDGSFPFTPGGKGQVNATAFAILGLSPIAEPSVPPALQRAVGWLISQQRGDGGWSWMDSGAVGEVDMTGAAIQALDAAGPPGDPARIVAFEAAQDEGFEYLQESQVPDGGFPALPASQGESNVASTAWAVQAIWSAGGNPETWRTGSGLASEEPLDYMESMQQPDGHIRWSKSADVNGVWMTAYVAPAFAGQALPIPEATLSNASRPPCGSEGNGTEAGVVAGGGGRGAPLFSRPKPQSRGRTPGGARIVRSEGLRARNHSPTRRGTNADQPTGTVTSEPGDRDAVVDSAAASSSAGRPDRGTGDGDGGEPGVSVPRRETVAPAPGKAGGREVSGALVGDLGAPRGEELAFGAPGLRSAGVGGESEPWAALGIAAAALLLMLSGARWERRREVLP